MKLKIRLKINVIGRGCLFRKKPAADKQYTEVVISRILETLINIVMVFGGTISSKSETC